MTDKIIEPKTKTDRIFDLAKAIINLPFAKLILVLAFFTIIGYFVFVYYTTKEEVEYKSAEPVRTEIAAAAPEASE